MTPILKSDQTTFILSPPQGKPNTKIPLQSGEEDTRPRIAQSPQKGPNCPYYCMHMLRDRIGPNPPSEYEEARRVEKLVSDFCKSRTVIEHDFEKLIPAFLKGTVKKGWDMDNSRDSIRKYLPVIQFSLGKISPPGENYLRTYPYFEEYCTQVESDDIHTYLEKKYLACRAELSMKFLNNMGISPKEQYEQMVLAEIREKLAVQKKEIPSENLEQIPPSLLSLYPQWEMVMNASNGNVLNGFAAMAAAKAFGFRTSQWTPLQTIDKLQEALKSEGPLMVGGLYGEALYTSHEPTVTETISDHPIYTWKPSDRRTFSSPLEMQTIDKHQIVIIGAAQGGPKGGYVYFVDPKNGSDPQNPLQQKIYKITYENLTSNISDQRGHHCPPPTKSIHGYAYYYPREK